MSDRVQAAQAEALRRLRREGRHLFPFRLCIIAIVVIVAATSTPSLGLSGHRLALTICFVVFVVEMLGWPIARREGTGPRVVELAVMGAAAVGIAALQPQGVSELAGSATVFVAGVSLPPRVAAAVGGAISVGVAAALGAAGVGVASVAASTLLCAVLGVTAALLRSYRISREQTEVLLAELQEARDDQARAAAAEARASIARELHDVLAHSLSGLSIQLEVARSMGRRTDVSPELRTTIDRAGELAKQGLSGARDALGALGRENHVGLDELPSLVEHFRRDLQLEVTYGCDGLSRPVPADVGFALYRVAGEALTNVARHAVGAPCHVQVSFRVGAVGLEVRDGGGSAGPLAEAGSGRGLTGMRERMERLGGELAAGPSGAGWRVAVSVPA